MKNIQRKVIPLYGFATIIMKMIPSGNQVFFVLVQLVEGGLISTYTNMKHKCPLCNASVNLTELSSVALFGLHLYLIHGLTLELIIVLCGELGKNIDKRN